MWVRELRVFQLAALGVMLGAHSIALAQDCGTESAAGRVLKVDGTWHTDRGVAVALGTSICKTTTLTTPDPKTAQLEIVYIDGGHYSCGVHSTQCKGSNSRPNAKGETAKRFAITFELKKCIGDNVLIGH